MSITVDSSAVNTRLQSILDNYEKNINVAIQESTQLLQEEIQASIEGQRAEHRSVDTGEFLRSIDTETGDLTGAVSTDVPQGLFMEFGTSKIPERRHFRNSTDRLIPTIYEKVTNSVSELLD